MKTIFLLLALCFSVTAFGQKQKPVTTTFTVMGVCEMCTKRIENAVDVKGVRSAEYNLSEHLLTITYSPDKIAIEKIHFLINEVGHDTSLSKASDEKYAKIHGCCNYREHEHNH
jgi:mercuric ion binding protein